MYKYILESIEQLNWLAIGPLILFFIFFIGVIIKTVKEKDTFIQKMENLPFDEKD